MSSNAHWSTVSAAFIRELLRKAALFAQRHPERVARLALDAFVWTGEGSPTLAERRKRLPEFQSRNRRPIDRAFVHSIFNRDHPGTADPATVEAFATAILALDDSVPTGTYVDMCSKLPLVDPEKIRVPTLVMRGEYDGIAGIDDLLAVAGSQPTPWLYDGRLRMAGVKLYLDGALGSRGAWLKEPYRDAPGQRGLPLVSDTVLKNLMSRAAMDGFQVAVHAIGDQANSLLLGAIDELAETYTGDRRWRIEHAQIVDPADLPRFARHGTIASMQPVHQTSDRLMAEARMGIERLGGAYAWRSMIANNVPLAFGSDFPVESPNPFHGLAAAISREDAQGQPPGGWLPEQRLNMIQAFDAFTRGAAYAGFAESQIGTLEPGRYADFILIDRDIFATEDQREIRETRVLETYVGGQKVWERDE